MDRPTIFNETINKKTSNRNKSSIPYEHGMLSQENRVFVDQTISDLKKSKAPTGYNGTPIIQEVFNFEQLYPGLTFKDADLLYDRMMNDARNVFPRNRDLKIMVNNYYNQAIHTNLNNIYHFAPRFFSDNFIPKTGINNAAFESYQVYIYLLCFIHYTDTHRDDVEVRELDNLDKILNWISTRRDPSIEYIINGPTSNSSLQTTDFRAHYKTLIDNSNDMTEIIAYNQLSSTQTISSDLYKLMNLISNMPNVYYKQPDEARKYNINIDTAQGVKVKIDNEMNLIFDCSYVNLGDVTEQNKLAKFENLESIITNNKVNSMINTKKLAELFHQYSRIKILELVITPDTYISALDAFSKVFVVFKGVSCSERNIYNTIETNFLKIGGKFNKTNRGYEFEQDVDAITYKSVLADVKGFEIYLTLDPSVSNKIVPNEYSLTIQKDNIFNHPITTDIVYDAKVRGTKKLLTVVETKKDTQIRSSNNDNDDFNFWHKPDMSKLVPELNNDVNSKLVVNEKSITSTDWISQIKSGSLTNNNLTLGSCLYRRWSNGDVATNLRNMLDFVWELKQLYKDVYVTSLLEQLSKMISSSLRAEELDVSSLILKLNISSSSSSTLSNNEKAIITDAILNKYEFFTDLEREHINEHLLTSSGYNKEIIDSIVESLTNDSLMSSSKQTMLNNIVTNADNINITYADKYGLINTNATSYTQEQKQMVYSLFSTLHCLPTSDIDKLNVKINSNDQINITYNESELTYISEFAQHTSELSLADISLIVTSLNETDTNESNDDAYNIQHHKSINTNNVLNAISLFVDYGSFKTSIISEINTDNLTWSNPDYQTVLTSMINRSLIIPTNISKLSLISLIDTPTHIYNSSEKDLIISIINADPTNSSDIIDKIKSYNQNINLHNNISRKANTYKSANELLTNPALNTEQLATILSNYDITLVDTINVSDVINFVVTLNKLTLFTYEPLSDLDVIYEFVNKNTNMLVDFFNGVSDKLSSITSDISKFINAYVNLITNAASITTNYNAYFKPIFDAETNYDVSTVKQLTTLLQIYINTYTILYNQLGFNKSYVASSTSTTEETVDYVYRTVQVNTTNATIEGQYFRVDGNGFATLGAETPDPDYLIYTEEENDLTLINLYRKFADVIKPINKSSFIYSETLSSIQNLPYTLIDYGGPQNRYKFDNKYILNEDGNMYYEYHELTKSNTLNLNKFDISITFNGSVSENETDVSSYNWTLTVDNTSLTSINDDYYNLSFTLTSDDGTVTLNGKCNQIKYNTNASTGYTSYIVFGLIETGTNENMIGLIMTANGTCSSGGVFNYDSIKLNNVNKGQTNTITITDANNAKTIIDKNFNITFDNNETLTNINSIVSNGTMTTDGKYTYITNYNGTNSDNSNKEIIYEYDPTTSTLSITDKYTDSTNTVRISKLIINTIHKSILHIESGNISSLAGGDLFNYADTLALADDENNLVINQSVVAEFDDYNKEPNVSLSNLYKSFIISDLDPKSDYWNRTAYVASLMLCPLESCFESGFVTHDSSPVTNDIVIDGKTENVIIYTYAPNFTTYTDTFKVTQNDILIDNGSSFIPSGLTSIYVNKNKNVSIYRNRAETDDILTIPLSSTTPITETIIWQLYDSEDIKSSSSVPQAKFYIHVVFDYYHVIKFDIYDSQDATLLVSHNTSVQSGVPCYVTINEQTYETVISYDVEQSDGVDVDNSNMCNYITVESITLSATSYNSVVYMKQKDNTIIEREFETMKFSNVPSKYTPSSDIMFSLTGNYNYIYKLHPIFKYAEKCFVIPRFIDSNNKFVMVAEKYNQNVMTKPVYLRSQYDLNSTTNNTIQDSDTVNYKIFPRSDPNKTHLMESINKDLVMIGTVDNTGYIKDVAITSGYVHAIPSSSKMLLSIEFS